LIFQETGRWPVFFFYFAVRDTVVSPVGQICLQTCYLSQEGGFEDKPTLAFAVLSMT
jgi:hypothetical protein